MSDDYLDDDYDSFNSTTFNLLKTIDDLTKNGLEPTKSGDIADPAELNDDPIVAVQEVNESQESNNDSAERVCTKCGLMLNKNSKYRALCIKCYNKNYAEANKEKFREYHRLKYLAKKQQLQNDDKQIRELSKLQKPKEEEQQREVKKSIKNKGQCTECGVSGKLLLKTKCVRCYQRAYQRRYRPKNGHKPPKPIVKKTVLSTNNSVDSTNFSYLVDNDDDDEEPNSSNAENSPNEELPQVKPNEEEAEEFDEKVTKIQKYCQECGSALSSKTTINRCKKCNKNHHRRASRKRVRERFLAQSQRICSTCGVHFKASPNANQVGLKCPNCAKKQKEEELVNRLANATEDDSAEIFQYLSTLTAKTKSNIVKSRPSTSNYTGKSRGSCEDCGEELPIRGYLMKCRKCNKKDYKKRMRLKKREEAQLNNPSPPIQNDIAKIFSIESLNNQNLIPNIDNNDELISNNVPSINSNIPEKRYCTECSVVLHTLCRYNLCRRCNKKRYKRDARRRKREQRLAEAPSNCEEIESPSSPIVHQSSAECLNQMIDLFNDENCDVDETPPSSQSLLDYFISQPDSHQN